MRTHIWLPVAMMLVGAGPAVAQTPPVEEIVNEANRAAYYAGETGRADVRMTIHDAGGSERVREFTILRMNTGGDDQKFYVYFRAPADVRRMAYLVWKQVGEGREDDRWMWLPALNLVRRIAPGDKRTSFVGSDFVYEDVSGRSLQADKHTLTGEDERHYLIRAVPRNPAEVEFADYTVWIDKATMLPVKAEYRDARGEVFRRVSAARIETIQGYPTVMESVVENLKTGGRTVNVFSNVSYDIGLNEAIFTERFLRRPPREVQP